MVNRLRIEIPESSGGILATYGALLAMYRAANGNDEYEALACQAMNYALYAINGDGCPGENSLRLGRAGWQEGAHSDKIHNCVVAMRAFPEWGK
jgi:hypothetical protein